MVRGGQVSIAWRRQREQRGIGHADTQCLTGTKIRELTLDESQPSPGGGLAGSAGGFG